MLLGGFYFLDFSQRVPFGLGEDPFLLCVGTEYSYEVSWWWSCLVCKPTVRGGCLVVSNHLRWRARSQLAAVKMWCSGKSMPEDLWLGVECWRQLLVHQPDRLAASVQFFWMNHPSFCVFLYKFHLYPLPRFLQSYWRGYLEDSSSFNENPPHLTLNHGFPVIRLSRPEKVA